MRLAALVLCAFGLVACGGKATTKPTTTTSSLAAAKPKVTVVGQDHHPHVGKPWHYEVHVTVNGKPVAALIHLQFLFGGSPVAEVGKHNVKNGIWQETFGTRGNPPFPAAAAGQPLVLEATVRVKGHPVAKAGWSILVQ